MSSNSNATNSNSSKNSSNKKNTKNEKVYRRFDTILKKTPEIYDNYLVLVNDFIKSKLQNVNNSKFYNSSKEGFNSNNETLSVNNQKKVYLNTYVIPLLYLINSYEYQKYYKNTMAIEANQLIMANIDYYKNYFFNYKLPIIKSVNVDIYKYNYGNASSNNNMNIDFSKSKKKKKVKIESKGIVAKVDKDIKENINKLLELLVKSNIIFKQLLKPYHILFKKDELNNEYNESTVNYSTKINAKSEINKINQYLELSEKKKKINTIINKYKLPPSYYNTFYKNVGINKNFKNLLLKYKKETKKMINLSKTGIGKKLQEGGFNKNLSSELKQKMNDFYNENLFDINKIIIACIKYIFDKPEYFNVDLLKLMKNRSDTLDYKFDIFEAEIEDYKDVFNVSKIYTTKIDDYKKKNEILERQKNKIQIDIKNLKEEIKKSSEFEKNLKIAKNLVETKKLSIDTIQRRISKFPQNIKNYKERKEKEKYNNQKSNLERNKQKAESDIELYKNKLNEIKTKRNTLNIKEQELNEIEDQITEINKKIKRFESNQISNSKNFNFSFEELKKSFTEFFKNNIETIKQIQKITDFEQQKKKQDKYKYYFYKDTLLINIIKELNNKFKVKANNSFSNRRNIKTTNITSKKINYQTLKLFGQNYEKLINIMKLYKKKENNNNSEYKSKIIKLLSNFDTYNTSQLERLISEEGILTNSFNSNDIVELISTYINNVQSKKETYDNSFFKKVMLDSTYYKTEDTLLYFKEIQEIHAKLLININKYLYEIESKSEKNIENNVFKEKFKEELEYLNNCFEKMKQKYNRLKTNIYNTKDTIYVYTYTDSIKFYFITLSLIELYLHNSTLT